MAGVALMARTMTTVHLASHWKPPAFVRTRTRRPITTRCTVSLSTDTRRKDNARGRRLPLLRIAEGPMEQPEDTASGPNHLLEMPVFAGGILRVRLEGQRVELFSDPAVSILPNAAAYHVGVACSRVATSRGPEAPVEMRLSTVLVARLVNLCTPLGRIARVCIERVVTLGGIPPTLLFHLLHFAPSLITLYALSTASRRPSALGGTLAASRAAAFLHAESAEWTPTRGRRSPILRAMELTRLRTVPQPRGRSAWRLSDGASPRDKPISSNRGPRRLGPMEGEASRRHPPRSSHRPVYDPTPTAAVLPTCMQFEGAIARLGREEVPTLQSPSAPLTRHHRR